MKTTGILFDCDGTLIDTEDQVIDSFQYALQKTNSPPQTAHAIKNLLGPGADKILLNIIGDKTKADAAFEYFIEDQKRVASSMRVYEGVRELLTKLKAAKFCIGVVTGRHSRDLDIILKAHELHKFFDVIIPDDELHKPKPSPEGILKAALELQIDSEKIYYVGDAKTDIEASHKANVKAVAALWDERVDREVMRLEKPFLMAETPMDIWDKLNVKGTSKIKIVVNR